MTTLRFSSDDILQMESRNRASLMNSLSGFKSASLIGTIDANSKTNLAIFSSVVHIGSNPALIGFINRPDSVSRHTLENILESNCFTVNHVNQDIFREAHQTSARYPKDISEFDAVGLSTEFSEYLVAPYVKESSIKYGLEFIEKHELKINGTILVIGKVVEIFIPKDSLLSNNAIDIEQAKTLAISGLDTYHSTNRIARLTYAKPDSFNEEMNE